ncbi:hypothetical protein [Metapseudomonas resinovorans]|uniref:Uncharacterized protein n=1 Tax=Metapseudomonas resinovorans NBRC 106553 TaxID=1245471 RepID=S6AGK0_METRE|nr:hypothetical protein [Pseudomonas resinovorans]BAN47190.1 hypothetical protein PCA10_14580 [Pseudomonas resinovorans NBRC 106553]
MKALITFTAVLAFSSASFADAPPENSRSGKGALYPEWLINHDG